MLKGKGFYLKQLTSQLRFRSADVGTELDGSTPPSVFIGAWNYPKVLAGPMFAPRRGDTSLFDSPERWIPEGVRQPDIVDFRVSLVRGKQAVKVTDVGGRLADKLRDISLSKGPLDSEARFAHAPRGLSISDEHTPHGPSAILDGYEVGNCGWDRDLEKAYNDTDLKAREAVDELYCAGTPFSRIQKAFSTGSFGLERNRRLVPTRWSITACDTSLANSLLGEVRHYEVIDCYRVHEFASLNNRYAVILMPTAWQYEWIEAFLHIIGREELVFSDCETNLGKRGYSRVGGCYYSCKFAVLEALAAQKRQAGAIILREAHEGYIPLGVFNVRENVRSALAQPATEHASLAGALAQAQAGLGLPVSRFMAESTLLRDLARGRQTALESFCPAA
jgi:DNA repair protein NreA